MKEGKIKTISSLQEREKGLKRKFWKDAQRESRERRKKAEEGLQSLNTPPQSPLDNTVVLRNQGEVGSYLLVKSEDAKQDKNIQERLKHLKTNLTR